MKEGLVKISDELNLFYDSVDRLYRYRMHCPYCGEVSGCRCFDTLEKAEVFMSDSVDFVCSSKCSFMMLIDDQGTDNISDTMKDMGIIWRLKWYIFKYTGYMSDEDCYRVIDIMELDWECIEGESC